ncbi:MAG: hypothetical protein LIQ30_12235 [Planctomycetes bacterium]|nr:hypothetical protein [Planctomycetota bacterium]MCD7896910.1 hypothetical protein [Planctomycetaceae bacterium]
MDNLEFPGLTIAARRLRLDVGELAESVLHAVDGGAYEMEAVRMTIIVALQRRGAYHGRLRRAIEDGTIFQVDDTGANTGDLSGPNIRTVKDNPDGPKLHHGPENAKFGPLNPELWEPPRRKRLC